VTTIELRALDIEHEDVQVFGGLDLLVPSGEVTALLGASGSGKTSLLRVVVGLAEPSGGQVLVDGVDVRGVRTRDLDFGYVPQGAPLLPHRDVTGNLAFPLRIRGLDRDDAMAEADRHGRRFGLFPVRDKRPSELSTGEQAAAGIARGTVNPPRALLLDEPVPHLDPRRRAEVLALVSAFQRAHGVTLLVATNDVHVAEMIADRVAVIDRGRIVDAGPLADVRSSPATVLAADLVAPAPLTWLPAVIEAGAHDREVLVATGGGGVRTDHHALRRRRGPVLLGIGGRDGVLTPAGTGSLSGRVHRVATTGARRLVTVATASGNVVVDCAPTRWLPDEDEVVDIDVRGGLVAAPDGTVIAALR
jgi:multiple sugar transport system ATP-binding protein